MPMTDTELERNLVELAQGSTCFISRYVKRYWHRPGEIVNEVQLSLWKPGEELGTKGTDSLWVTRTHENNDAAWEDLLDQVTSPVGA